MRTWLNGINRIVVLAVAVLSGSAPNAQAQQAQPSQDAWKITFAPYLMGAGLNGTTGIGPFESDVELSAHDVVKNLRFGFMGYFAAMKGDWGVASDVIWMSLRNKGGTVIPVTVEADQGGFTFVGVRRLGPAADLRFGAVANTIRPSITLGEPLNIKRSRTETWVDPVVGLNLHTPDTGRTVNFLLMTDVGGFGVGSDVMLNVEPVVTFRLTRTAALALGYRWIYLKYENEGDETQLRFLYDVLSSGPMLGLVFRF